MRLIEGGCLILASLLLVSVWVLGGLEIAHRLHAPWYGSGLLILASATLVVWLWSLIERSFRISQEVARRKDSPVEVGCLMVASFLIAAGVLSGVEIADRLHAAWYGYVLLVLAGLTSAALLSALLAFALGPLDDAGLLNVVGTGLLAGLGAFAATAASWLVWAIANFEQS